MPPHHHPLVSIPSLPAALLSLSFLSLPSLHRVLPSGNSVPQWGAESPLAGLWLPAAGGDGAWAARTGSGPMRMCGGRGVGVAGAGRAEAWACSGRGAAICVRVFSSKSFVEMDTVRCCPLWHPAHCPMGVPRVLVRRITSPAHADFGGLSSGAALVVVRLDVVPLPPRSSSPTVAICRLG